MTGEAKGVNLQAIVAVGGLVISLAGNWIQYQTVVDKRVELSQAQKKLDSLLDEIRKKEETRNAKRRDLESRMEVLDQKIVEADFEIRRGAAGLMYAPLDQKQMAAEIMQAAQQLKESLLKDKAALQEKIDRLPTDW